MKLVLAMALSLGLVWACGEPSNSSRPIKIATNPWPGYEFLHLADHLGYFKQVELNVELIQLGSLSDAQQVYLQGNADGLTSTLIEAVQAPHLGGKPLQVVLIPDFSNGGDVIIANKNINSISELKGKKVGAEVSSLGIYILARALQKYGMDIDDVELVNVEQANGETALLTGQIDAFVTYPPVSSKLLHSAELHQVFDTSEIPYEILDTVSLSIDSLSKHPNAVQKLKSAWQMALDYSYKHPAQAYQIMAKREQITEEEFITALQGIEVLSLEQQSQVLSSPNQLTQLATQVCRLLVELKNINTTCHGLENLFYR